MVRRKKNAITLTKCGLTRVTIDVYLSTTGGNPISSCALQYPERFESMSDFLHQGTKSL